MLMDPSLIVLYGQNVADYYYKDTGQEDWDLVEHFPNLAPPWPQFWVEYAMPNQIHSDKRGDTDMRGYIQDGHVGMLITGLDREDVESQGLPDGCRWILWIEIFLNYGKFKPGIEGPHGSIFLAIDQRGALLERPWMQSLASPIYNEIMRSLITWTHPALLAITFLHCKNVTVVENTVDKPLAKKYHARTGQWPAKYKTLVIEPLKQVLRKEGGSEKHGLQRALRICRGHFSDYREGRGLFGKYKQLVWYPMRVKTKRGDPAPPVEVKIKV